LHVGFKIRNWQYIAFVLLTNPLAAPWAKVGYVSGGWTDSGRHPASTPDSWFGSVCCCEQLSKALLPAAAAAAACRVNNPQRPMTLYLINRHGIDSVQPSIDAQLSSHMVHVKP